MFAEEIEMFVIEPMFHGSLHWNSPIVPVLFVAFIFAPVCYFVIKAVYFSNSSDSYSS